MTADLSEKKSVDLKAALLVERKVAWMVALSVQKKVVQKVVT
jgi:hypothetical protein